MKSGVKLGGKFNFWCYGPDGALKWKDEAKNIVVTEGLDYMLGILLKNSVQSDPWYVGLTDGAPTTDNGDSLTGTHAGWTEVTAFSEGARQEFVDGTIASSSIDNSASKASFSINATTTIGGAFLADSATTGANGTLLCVAAFTGGNKTADSGDTLDVQYTFSASDDGA